MLGPTLLRNRLALSVGFFSFLAAESAHAFTGPLRASADQRYLVDAAGKPFFVSGEAAWSAVANLSEADALLYLDDCASRGFNAVMVNVIEHRFSANPPANALGVAPFAGVPFQSAMSQAYLDHVRWFVKAAAQRDIAVFANPAYLGFGGGEEGWQRELEAGSTDAARAWGAFVGGALQQEDNLVWHLFGDFDPPSRVRTNAVFAGLSRAAPRQTLFAHHFGRGKSSTDAPEPWLTWSYVYPPQGAPVHLSTLRGYEAVPRVPQILGEGYYEGDPELPTAADVRRQAWSAVTSGAAGHFYGHRTIWGFGNGIQPADWRGALAATARGQMRFIAAFFRARRWWLLEPDRKSTLLIAGRGDQNSNGYVTAALASDRSWGVVYIPAGAGPVTIDLARFATKVSASWLNPRTGKSLAIATWPSSGTQRLAAPDGEDWVLALDGQAAPATNVPAAPGRKTYAAVLGALLLGIGRARRGHLTVS